MYNLVALYYLAFVPVNL